MHDVRTQWVTSAYNPIRKEVKIIPRKDYSTEQLHHLVLALIMDGFIGRVEIYGQLINAGYDPSLSKVSSMLNSLYNAGYLVRVRRGRCVYLVLKEES